MAFQEINPSTWTYEKEGDSIEGFLVKVEKDVGPNNSMLYTLDRGEEGMIDIWGSTILDNRMIILSIGDYVKIEYKGLGEAKQGKKPAKIFKVYVDKEKIKEQS